MKKNINLPNFLTVLRILAVPFCAYALFKNGGNESNWQILAWCGFFAVGLTDFFDGRIARSRKQITSFGAFLDPVADKLMVSAALLALLNLDRVDVMIALIIIGREITISALREWMAQLGASASVAVHWLGKFKTAAQMIAIPCLLYHANLWGIPVARVGQVLIVVAAILTVWSMLYYLRRAWPVILEKTT